jgi:magnesium-transporting ATPase (P-type)
MPILNIKARKLKRNFIKFLNLIKFNSINFSKSKQIILFWIILAYLSLFLNWINFTKNKSENIFNNITVFSWIIIFLILSFLVFIVFSRNYKNNLKKIFNINLKDYNFFIYFSITIFFIWISTLSNIIWLKRFESEIFYWKWAILLLSATILIFIWGLLLKKENKQKDYTCINESEEEIQIKKEKNNMKLPI